jgi:hypothetical protein
MNADNTGVLFLSAFIGVYRRLIVSYGLLNAIPVSIGTRHQFEQGLRRMSILRPGQGILVETIRDIQYGHVLHNRATRASIRLILEYLRAGSILTCGKYGQWRDMLIPQSILRICQEITAPCGHGSETLRADTEP